MKRIVIFAGLLIATVFGTAVTQAQSVIGWNFGTGTANAGNSSGTPANFTVGNFGVGNTYGTVSSPINTSSASSGYTGASGFDNIGNAVNVGALSTASSAYYSVTFTPVAGYALQITAFNFGMRSTSTGPQTYALYSSVDNFTTSIFTGTIGNNSTWTFKTSPTFTLNGSAGSAVTFRLYTYGGSGSPVSGTENNRMDDVAITVSSALPVATQVSVETLPDGTGTVVPARSFAIGPSLTAYAISRTSGNAFVANVPGTWSLTGLTGSVVSGDLAPSGDNKSATFTANHPGTAVIHVVSGSLSSVDSGTLTVNAAPTSPTGVAVDRAAGTVYVVNTGGGTVSVINAATRAVTATIPVGSYPWGVAVDPTARTVYVANAGGGTVSVISTATRAVTATIPVGSGPTGVAVNPARGTVYVTNTDDGTVSVINAATRAVTATIPVGSHPYGVAVNPARGTVYVTNNGAATVSVINAATRAVTATIPVGSQPDEVAVDPATRTAYVADYVAGTVSVIAHDVPGLTAKT